MKTVVIGSENFGVRCTQQLLEMGVDVAAIFTMERDTFFEKMAVSMEQSHFSSFENISSQFQVPVHYVTNINSEGSLRILRDIQPDIIAVFAWSQIIKKPLLELPAKGVIGFHDSLLPKRRGGAPINWAIIDGLTTTGQTLFYYAEKVDSGDIIAQRKFTIEPDATCETLSDQGADVALELLAEYFPLLAKGTAPRKPQDHEQATQKPRRKPEDGLIDWKLDATKIHNLVRGVTKPFPGAFTHWNEEKLIIWKSSLVDDVSLSDMPAGKVINVSYENGVVVATGNGAIRLLELRFQEADQAGIGFAKSHGVQIGSRIGNPADKDA